MAGVTNFLSEPKDFSKLVLWSVRTKNFGLASWDAVAAMFVQ